MAIINYDSQPRRLATHDTSGKLLVGDKYWLATLQLVEVLEWISNHDTRGDAGVSYASMMGYLALNYGLSHHYVECGAFTHFESDDRFMRARQRLGSLLRFNTHSNDMQLPLDRVMLHTSPMVAQDFEHSPLQAIVAKTEGIKLASVMSYDRRGKASHLALVPCDGWTLTYLSRSNVTTSTTYSASRNSGLATVHSTYHAHDRVILHDKGYSVSDLRLTTNDLGPGLASESGVLQMAVEELEFWPRSIVYQS